MYDERTERRHEGQRIFDRSDRYAREREEWSAVEAGRRNGRRPSPPPVDEVAGSEFM